MNLIKNIGPELFILLDAELPKITEVAGARIAEGLRRMRAGELIIKPGYDGVYGEVRIFSEKDREMQNKLF